MTMKFWKFVGVLFVLFLIWLARNLLHLVQGGGA